MGIYPDHTCPICGEDVKTRKEEFAEPHSDRSEEFEVCVQCGHIFDEEPEETGEDNYD